MSANSGQDITGWLHKGDNAHVTSILNGFILYHESWQTGMNGQ